jgi:major type 1 subunit fimbrin (pilin)
MKKNLIAAAIAATTLMSAASALAADGTVNFTGEIIPNPCVVDIGTNNTMTVDLGRVAISAFSGPGSKASATKFVLKLKDCPTDMVARFKFDGTPYDGDDSVLKLTQQTGVAKGVAIELADVGAVLPLFTASTGYQLVAGVENELPFYARYIQKAATVEAGIANATSTFTVNYN